MPLTTREAVVNMAPELAATPDGSAWTQAIEDAEVLVSVNSLGAKRAELAARYYVAHRIAVLQKKLGTASGAVVSESIAGVLSRTYAASVNQNADDLDLTAYGKTFRRLSSVHGPAVL